MRFRLPVPPRQTAVLAVEEAKPLESTYRLTQLGDNEIALLVQQRNISPAIEAELRKLAALRAEAGRLEEREVLREEEIKNLYGGQQRLRENLKALKGSAEEKALLQRYTKQLNDQEDRLAEWKRQQQERKAQIARAIEAAGKAAESLAMDSVL